METTQGAQPTRSSPVAAVVACVLGGHVIGGSVAAVVLEAPWLIVAAALSGFVSLWPARRWVTVRQDDASSTEWLIAMGNVVISGLAGAMIALSIGGIGWLATSAIDWFGWGNPDTTTAAQWAAGVALVLIPLAIANDRAEQTSTAEVMEMIQPTAAPFELPLRQKELQGGALWWLGFLALMAAIVVTWVTTGFESTLTKYVWGFAALLGASACLPGGSTVEADDRYEEIVRRLADALDADDYEAIVNPVTDDPEVDRSLGDIDILARADGRTTLLVDVRLDCNVVGWHEATKLVTAAGVCKRWLDDKTTVVPLLVLVDAEADDGVADMLGDTGLRIVEYRVSTGELELTPEDPALRRVISRAFDGLSAAVRDEKKARHG